VQRILPLFLFILCFFAFQACEQVAKEQAETSPQISTILEEQFDLRNDSIIFNSGTIENFDQAGNSIDVYWLNEARDTVLRFYRKYDSNQQLIGAEYYEEGDSPPNFDTVYFNAAGQKVEASLNAEGIVTWKSTITEDEAGNEVLRRYENGKGEPRGLDSAYFDTKNRLVKGFYQDTAGKKYSIRTYKYLEEDQYENWTLRQLFKDGELKQKQTRTLTYF